MLPTNDQEAAKLISPDIFSGVMKDNKKILTLPRVLHIMQYIQIVRQLYCIPACTFLRRSELRRTVEYAT